MVRTPLLLACLSAPAVANTHLYQVPSPNGGQTSFSAVLEVTGDLDQDGFPDLLVGSRYAPEGGLFQIRSGRTGALIRQVAGSSQFESLGWALSSVGDADGDGAPDVLALNQFPGEARLYSGATGVLVRAHASARHGRGIGDWNADGRGDYAVSYSDHTTRIHSGLDGGTLLVISARYASDPVAVGDVTGDGVPDVGLVHIVEPPFPQETHGRVSVFSGATGTEVHGVDAIDGELFGRLITVADRDGDGRRDLAFAHTDWFPTLGRIVVHSSATGALLLTIANPEPVADPSFRSDFGSIALAELGDIDLDGVPDLAGGSSRPRGLWVFSGATGARLMAVQTANAAPDYYVGVAGLPDIDGDARAELAYGDPTFASAPGSVGTLHVVRGTIDNSRGTTSCHGDGSATACPCGNVGPAGAGCANTTGTGASLRAFGSGRVGVRDTWFLAEGLPGGSGGSTYLFRSSALANGGLGVASFAGVRCAGGTLSRIGQHSWKGGGVASWTPQGVDPSVFSVGTPVHFQSLYRDVTSPCAPANYTNLVSVTFAP